MIDYLAAMARGEPNALQARNLVREYLQALILASLQRAGAMIPLAFHGGTALRFLYSIPRYSEDLDFALDGDRTAYDFRAYLRAVRGDLEAQGYTLDVKVSDHRVVHSAFFRFRNLLHTLDLSPQRDAVLAVKIEVDTNPPAGAVLNTTVVRRHVVLHLQHHDPGSLLAGKLHAVLQRRYVKGRDLYDLLWYLSAPDWPSPNLALLNNALLQTGWSGGALTVDSWRGAVTGAVADCDWQRVAEDVRPFLQAGSDVDWLTRDHLLRLLEQRTG